ncbi:DNA-methyltransferase [Leucobacter sp. HY1910]
MVMGPETSATLQHGDCLDHLRDLPDHSIDAIVTDPPYGLSSTGTAKVTEALTRWIGGERDFVPAARGFMSAAWDGFVPPPAVWDECLRVLKPGGHMVVFTGARTQDLMGLSVRLAGFELRDGLGWARSGGMPKTQDLGKQMAKAGIEHADEFTGWSAGLKPAIEPILLARKPFTGSLTKNAAEHGTGALNINATRIAHRSDADRAESEGKNKHAAYGTAPGRNDVFGNYSMVASKDYDGSQGRWPSNLILDPSQAAELDAQSGTTRSRIGEPRGSKEPGHGWGATHTGTEYDDEGGASRFFQITEELDDLDTRLIFAPRAPASERPIADGVQHTTVKPLSLMRYLVRLITPPGGTVLEPFAGSGTTVEAALLEGFDVIGIEREAAYLPLIEQRIARAQTILTEGAAA